MQAENISHCGKVIFYFHIHGIYAIYQEIVHKFFVFGGWGKLDTVGNAQGLLLPLYPGITPGGPQGTI